MVLRVELATCPHQLWGVGGQPLKLRLAQEEDVLGVVEPPFICEQ